MRELVAIVEQAENGELNALEVMATLRDNEKQLKALLGRIEPHAFVEADKYTEKTISIEGYEVTKKDGARRFDYKHIEEWQAADQAKKNIEAQYKQAFISAEKNLLAVTKDGEELVLPKALYSKPSLSFKRKQ